MARLVFGMNQSLDGYVDHTAFAPCPVLFRHFVDQAAGQAGSIYGRRMYEVMRYWDDDHAEWSEDEKAFAAAWRRQQKWVVSRSLHEVGANARLISGDVEQAVAAIKADTAGEIEVAGPTLAYCLASRGLIDEVRVYLHPVVLGGGQPMFVGALPPLRLVTSERIGANAVRLGYVPAEAGVSAAGVR